MEYPACTQSGVTGSEGCASYGAIARQTPTYSFPSVAAQSAPSVSTGLSIASVKPPRCHSRSTPTCCAMPVGSSSPMMATTRGPCSTTSATRTSSTRSGTPKWRPTGSRTFGGIDDDGADDFPYEHIYWDQASLLIGLLDLAKLPRWAPNSQDRPVRRRRSTIP